jgi:effector-binding domain-containing protein
MATPRGIAAVRARVRAGRAGATFKQFLDQVYAAARSGAIELDGQNIFVYRNVADSPEAIDVEFGVGTKAPFSAVGQVMYSQLPVGEVATITHWGSYAELDGAHNAIWAWCKEHDRTPSGVRWEVYGHWTNDSSQLRTDVFYLLESLSS